jgi:hypothetical protein
MNILIPLRLNQMKQIFLSLFLAIILNMNGFSQDNELIKSLDIKYSLYNNLSGNIIKEVPEPFRLNTSIHKVKPGESIDAIIQKNGFLFDGETLTLLYILNPDLIMDNWGSVTELVIPVLNKNSEYLNNIKKQEFISIICYSKLKKEISDKISASDKELDKIIRAQKQKNISGYPLFEEIRETSDILLKLIASGIRPLNKEFLENILAEIDDLSQLETDYDYLELAEKDNIEALLNIKGSLELMARTGIFKRETNNQFSQFPKVNVAVNILDNKKRNEKLKVYYVPRARLNKKEIYYKEFDKFSPPSVNQLITIGSYWFWAGRANNLKAQTNLQKVDVTGDKDQIEIELMMIE